MDIGKIIEATDSYIDGAEYSSSLETMEKITIDEKCILIMPYKCQSHHLILIDEFIRSNLKGEFRNPYTRNQVGFSKEDLKIITDLRREYIKNMKNDLHEIFVQFLLLMKFIQSHELEIQYFPEISKIFNIILTALPFFEELENAFGNYDNNYEILFKEIKSRVIHTIDTFRSELNEETNIERAKELISFMTIPDEIKDIIRYIFSNFLILLSDLSESKTEFEHKDALVNIFSNLDDIHYIYTSFSHLSSISNIDIKIQLILCMIQDEIEKLRVAIRP